MNRSQGFVILFCFISWIGSNLAQDTCRDIISRKRCLVFKNNQGCRNNHQTMKMFCPKTCDFCQSCKDRLPRERCLLLKKHLACITDHERMKMYCPRTCNFCPPFLCSDQRLECKEWQKHGACHFSAESMLRECPKTCGACNPRTPCDGMKCPRGQKCRLNLRGRPYCSCAVRCRYQKNTGPVCGSNKKTYRNLCQLLKDECRTGDFITVKHYGQCIKYEPCRDNADPENKICAGMSKNGACQTNKELMQFYCAKTCRLCRQLAPSPSCSASEFGCCWNEDVPAKGRYAQGCGKCEDKSLCSYFKYDCGNAANVNHLKKYCPASCHYCISADQITRGYR